MENARAPALLFLVAAVVGLAAVAFTEQSPFSQVAAVDVSADQKCTGNYDPTCQYPKKKGGKTCLLGKPCKSSQVPEGGKCQADKNAKTAGGKAIKGNCVGDAKGGGVPKMPEVPKPGGGGGGGGGSPMPTPPQEEKKPQDNPTSNQLTQNSILEHSNSSEEPKPVALQPDSYAGISALAGKDTPANTASAQENNDTPVLVRGDSQGVMHLVSGNPADVSDAASNDTFQRAPESRANTAYAGFSEDPVFDEKTGKWIGQAPGIFADDAQNPAAPLLQVSPGDIGNGKLPPEYQPQPGDSFLIGPDGTLYKPDFGELPQNLRDAYANYNGKTGELTAFRADMDAIRYRDAFADSPPGNVEDRRQQLPTDFELSSKERMQLDEYQGDVFDHSGKSAAQLQKEMAEITSGFEAPAYVRAFNSISTGLANFWNATNDSFFTNIVSPVGRFFGF